MPFKRNFVTQCIEWIRDTIGFQLPTTEPIIGAWSDIGAASMHEALAAMTGGAFAQRASVDLELFHLYRTMRNCHIHSGGSVSSALRTRVGGLSHDAQVRWLKLTKRDVSTLIGGDRANYSLLDVFAIFAVTKELGRGINALLRTCLSQTQWAEACVDDYCQETARAPKSDVWGRGLIGFARNRYHAVELTDQALFQAAANKGVWPDPDRRP